MVVTVKVQCENGDIYRLTLQEEPTFKSVVQLVADCCPDVQTFLDKGGICPLKYADEEEDWCTLAPATFEDFLKLQSNSNLLKLRLMSRPSSPVIKEPKGVEDSCRSPPEPTAPPGLEKEEAETAGPAGSTGAWGPGGNGGGPRRLLMALHLLQEAEMLTPAMFASLAVQWLPLLTQRVARKVDKINHMARQGLDHSNKAVLGKIQDPTTSTKM